VALCALGCALGLACNTKEKSPIVNSEAGLEPSPNASILPAPLASGTEPRPRVEEGLAGIPADSAGRLIVPEAGPPAPRALREDEQLPRDTLTSKDSNGATLEARFRWYDTPAPPPGAPVVTEALKKAREKADFRVTVDLAASGRMRFVLASPAFPLPASSELRARLDRYGHVLVWPNGNAYRVLIPGALRSMFGERRADVAALVQPKVRRVGAGRLLGFATTRDELTTETGQLVLEQASVPGVGPSGELLCRLLVELIAAEPAARICDAASTPLKAEYRWSGGGRLGFEVSTATRRQDIPIGHVFVPPAAALLKPGELPPQTAGVMHTREELAELRARPVSRVEPPPEGAPGEGLTATNRTDLLIYVLLDGVPIAWVRPRSEQYVIGPKAGRYSIALRDFFGAEIEPNKAFDVPTQIVVGAERDSGGSKH
jgi:hypothetical protein